MRKQNHMKKKVRTRRKLGSRGELNVLSSSDLHRPLVEREKSEPFYAMVVCVIGWEFSKISLLKVAGKCIYFN
ncbi:hypothetical protein DMH88_07185 [Escherichia coli]|nr:hypothetical protein [Escherichia coli]